MYKYLIILVLILSFSSPKSVLAQSETVDILTHPQKFYQKFFPNLKIKKTDIDTLYIKSYPKYLTIGTDVILPKIDLDIISKSKTANARNAASNYRTDIGYIIALSASYRFVTAGFAIGIPSTNGNTSSYTITRYRTATLKYNAAAYYLQFKYIRTRGFTDINTFNLDYPNVTNTPRADLLVKEFQFEGMYNFHWKKYSYNAAIDYTQRQLKSRFGMLLKGGIYYNNITADKNLLTIKQIPYYEEFNDIRRITSTSLKIAPGFGANIVFLKKLYFAAAVFTPYNIYFYKYYTTDEELIHKGNSLAFVFDGNISIGYQSRRMYAGIRYQIDNKSAKLNSVDINTQTSFWGIDLGYRFITPAFIKKFYRATMPPGM